MTTFTLICCAWLALFGLLGLWKGFWKALATLAALILAYLGSAIGAEPIAELINTHAPGMPGAPEMTWWIAAIVLFVAIGIGTRIAVVLVGKSFPVIGLPNRIGGALFGAAHGAAMGAVVLWGVAIVVQTDALKGKVSDETIAELKHSRLVALAQRSVGAVVTWQSDQADMSDQAAKLSSTFAAKPAETIASFKGVVQTPGFKQMVQDPELNSLVESGDLEQLADSPRFQAFLDEPAVAQFRAFLDENGMEASRESVAEQTAELWKKAKTMNNRPELKALLQDPKVREFLNGESTLNPALIAKAKDALLLLNAPAEPELEDSRVHIDHAGADQDTRIFSWIADDGTIMYTDYDHVPEAKKAEAKLLRPE